MFESANLSHKIDKATYKREAPRLREALLNAQFDHRQNGRFPVLILIAGVEGFCAEADWMRAYAEINDFEQQLAHHDVVVVKFWLAIGKAGQYKRFKARGAAGPAVAPL